MYVHPRGSHEIPLIGCERAIWDLFAGIKQIFGKYVLLDPLFIVNAIDICIDLYAVQILKTIRAKKIWKKSYRPWNIFQLTTSTTGNWTLISEIEGGPCYSNLIDNMYQPLFLSYF